MSHKFGISLNYFSRSILKLHFYSVYKTRGLPNKRKEVITSGSGYSSALDTAILTSIYGVTLRAPSLNHR